jgi:hypothetical protein
MLYAAAIVLTVFIASGRAVAAVAAVGAVLLGLYYAALRRNLRS